MQRHDDGVRNNVIHPSVICPCPFRRHANDGSADKPKYYRKKEKRDKRNGNKTDDQRGIRSAIITLQSRDARHSSERAGNDPLPPPSPPPSFALSFGDRTGWTMYVVAMYHEPSLFPKAISCSSLKATTNQASQALCGTYQASPCCVAPATGLLDPLKFPCTPPSGYHRIGFYLTFHQQKSLRLPHGIFGIAKKMAYPNF